jgi:SOS response regulatory protein OraA/RecX
VRPLARVTALRPEPGNRVGVDVDGVPWRVVPAAALVRAGLHEGVELDRPTLRLLRQELRRSEALGVAGTLLRRRELSVRELEAHLERADVAPATRAEVLDFLTGTGVVNDERLATVLSGALARRGWGDAAIDFRLEQRGIDADTAAAAAHAGLAPESDRARRILAARGRSPRTVAFLRRRGFSEDAIESAFGAALADGDAEGYDVGRSHIIFPA